MSVCIEDLHATDPNRRFLRCVAVPGRAPGLQLDDSGHVLWRSDEDVACELWVSADNRLVLWRREESPPVVVSRSGRSLSIPDSKPVMLIHGDEVELASRRLRIHVHGDAFTVQPPEPIVVERSRRVFRTAATAAIVGATLVAGAAAAAEQEGPIEVREHPPAPMPAPPDASPEPADAGSFADPPPDDAREPDAAVDTPIEVRDTPPAVVAPPPAGGGCCGRQPGTESALRRLRSKS